MSSQLTLCHIPLLTLFLTFTAGGPVPGALTLVDIQAIEHFTGDVMACANIPGLGLGIIRGDATYETGLGIADMDTGHPVDKRTIFNLGSTAKAFVPYILAELMNGRDNSLDKMTWNSTLRDIVLHHLDIEVPSPWGDLTLREMLIYPSGSSAADLATMAGLPENVEREEFIRRLRFLPEDDNFRSSNHYSNIMYTVASHVAERLSKMSWSELVKVRVFDKQNMNASSFAPEGMDHEDTALPYRYHAHGQSGDNFVQQDRSLFDLRPSEPVGSLMASAEDITKWLRHILFSINAKGSDSGINHMIKDALHSWVNVPEAASDDTIAKDMDKTSGYGMGWFVSKYRDLTCFKYRGSLYAYMSQIWLFPDVQTGIFIATNGPDSDNTTQALDGIMYHISDVVLGLTPWLTKEALCCCHSSKDVSDNVKADTTDKQLAPLESQQITYLAPLDKYTGSYGNGIVGDLLVNGTAAHVLEMRLGRNLIGHLSPDGDPSSMKFQAYKPLLNTAEWSGNTTVKFEKEDFSEDSPFSSVTLYINDRLAYKFIRGTSYAMILHLAEESDNSQNHVTGPMTEEDHTEETTSKHEEESSDNHNEYSLNINHEEKPQQAKNESVIHSHEGSTHPNNYNHHSEHTSNEETDHQDNDELKESQQTEDIHHRGKDSNDNIEKTKNTESKDSHEPRKEDSEESVENNEHKNIDHDIHDKQSSYDVIKVDSHKNDISGHQSHEPWSDERDNKDEQNTAISERKVNNEQKKTKKQGNYCSRCSADVTFAFLTLLICILF